MLTQEDVQETIELLQDWRADVEAAIAAMKRVAAHLPSKPEPERPSIKPHRQNRYSTSQKEIAVVLRKLGRPATPYMISQELKKSNVVVKEEVVKRLIQRDRRGHFKETDAGIWALADYKSRED